MSLKHLIFLEKTKFICSVIEEKSKEIGAKCYSVDNIEDLSYLMQDICPEILLIDTRLENWQSFTQYELGDSIVVALVEESIESDLPIHHQVKLPFSPDELFDQIQSWVRIKE